MGRRGRIHKVPEVVEPEVVEPEVVEPEVVEPEVVEPEVVEPELTPIPEEPKKNKKKSFGARKD